jgi:hypothetical protein
MQDHTYGYVLLICIQRSTSITYAESLLDIKADKLMFGIDDDSVFSDFEANELQDPFPRKEVEGRTVYVSRELRMPKRWVPPCYATLARPSLVIKYIEKTFNLISIGHRR